MSIVQMVSTKLKEAMKARDKDTVRALRSMRAKFIEAMKEDNSDTLADEKAVVLLRKLAKQRIESIDAFSKAGRDDLLATEQSELLVIEAFLPKLADEATTTQWVEQAIEQTKAKSPSDMGKVMGALMKAHKGDMDAKLANKIVRAKLV